VFAVRDRFRLIHVEPAFSRTAAMADDWLPRADAVSLAKDADRPVLVIDPGMSSDAVALNRELGGWGRTIRERAIDTGRSLRSIPDGSIGLLYIDESHAGEYIPWPEIARKLAPEAVTIAFAWSREGYARHARFVLPATVYPEALDDLPDGRVAMPLVKPPEGVIDPVDFIAKASLAGALKDRPAASDAGDWLVPYTGTLDAAALALSTKLYQESGLLLGPREVAIHAPGGMPPNRRAFLETSRGRLPVRVTRDAALEPGGVRFLRTPDVLDLCGSEEPKVVFA
jgi:hypothetical protein